MQQYSGCIKGVQDFLQYTEFKSIMPQVTSTSFLTLHYRLSGPQGDIINTFGGQPATLSLGTGELSPAVEQRLLGLEEGTHQRFELPAGEAFGPRNPEMLQWVAKKLLAQHGDPLENYNVGDVVQFPAPSGEANGSATFAGAVREVQADKLLFDFNHPLAGQPVSFEVQLIGVLD
jgi:FKBP-type peptidyl-prolyl cis-trans isomerase SlpA